MSAPTTDITAMRTFVIDLPASNPAEPPPDVPPTRALDSEWVLTNGRGSFVMGTAAGTPTRRYHSLLTVAQRPPVQRISLIGAVVDTVSLDGRDFDLASFEFHAPEGQSVFHPRSHHHLRRFEKDLSVRWVYDCGPIRVIKRLELVWGQDIAVLSYRIEPAAGVSDTGSHVPESVKLTVKPLVTLRDFHHQRRAAGVDPFVIELLGSSVRIATDSLPPLWIRADGASFSEQRHWWYSFKRRRESDRLQDDTEDLFCPGTFEHTFDRVGREISEARFYLSAKPLEQLPENDGGRRALVNRLATHILRQVGPSDFLPPDTIAALAAAANDFVVTRIVDDEPMTSILAGYPWFADWGRDTMISLPGLLLTTGRYDEARKTLAIYGRHIRNGLVPNRFDDYGGEPHYNTVDASMWFMHAALEYLRITGDRRCWEQTLADACRQIIAAYQRGTDGPIYMDGDGLIVAGNAFTQLTWMDAKRDGVVFTPRYGKAVEINALWYRGLVGCAEAMQDFDRVSAEQYRKLAAKVKRSFNKVFWDEQLGHLLDHVNEHHIDKSFRPNQLVAVSMPESPLSQARQKRIMEHARKRLLTPVGLRTLPPDDWHYHGTYGGSMFERDRAYHQGTVWPWLIGPFIEGYLRANKFSAAARKQAREDLKPLLREFAEHAMGQFSEVYTGDAPHRPDGCIAQAWSVAELLRACVLVETA